MCVILGHEQSWWTILGLFLDIFGFLVLAYDLYASVDLEISKENMEGVIKLLRRQLIADGNSSEILDRMADEIHMKVDRTRGNEDPPRMRYLKTRRRAIKPAIIFIVLGFAFQIVGAWPC